MSDALAPPRSKRRPGSPEHALQIRIKRFVSECVVAPHRFLAFDRSKKQSLRQHIREKARGLESGTPDTVLIVPGPSIWCELKAAESREGPTDNQEAIGGDIIAAGHYWCWAKSVEQYRAHLVRFGVPLRPNAAIVAMRYDALIEGWNMKRTGKIKRPVSRARVHADRPTIAQVRRAEAARRLPR